MAHNFDEQRAQIAHGLSIAQASEIEAAAHLSAWLVDPRGSLPAALCKGDMRPLREAQERVDLLARTLNRMDAWLGRPR